MTKRQPGNDPLEQLLRDFFAREMPPELRALPDRTELVRPTASPGRPVRRLSLVGLVALGLTACGVLAIVVAGRHDGPHELAPDRGTVESPASPPPSVAHAMPEPPSIAGAAPPATDDTTDDSGAGDESSIDEPLAVVQRTEPVERRTVATPRGPVEQRTDFHWTTVRTIDADAGVRAEYAIPSEITIEIVPLAATGDRVADIEPLVAPKPPLPVPLPVEENYLGVFTVPPGPLSQDQPFAPLGGVRGLAIVDVLPGSPADAAGLERNDILFAFDGEPLDTVERLRELVGAARPDAAARLDVVRDGQATTVSIALGRRQATDIARHDGELVLPDGATIYGGDRLRLDAAGRPVFAEHRADAVRTASPLVIRIFPLADGRYEVQREPADSPAHGDEAGRHADKVLLTGTPAELSRGVSDRTNTNLDADRERLAEAIALLSESKSGDGVRCRLRPQLRDQRLHLRITLTWQDADGRFHLVDYEQAAERDRPFNVADLPNVAAFAAELARMPAASRDVLEATLRRLSPPGATVRVERVQ